jgi:hypothetical protein
MADETTTTIDNQEQQTPPQKPTTDDAPVLTQKQVDAIVGERVKKASSAALSSLAEKLGFQSVEEMETAALEAQDAKKKNQTELDREKDARVKAEKERDELKLQKAEIEKARIADRVDNKLRSLVTAAKASNTDDVMDLLTARKKSEIEKLVDDDGKIDEKAAEKLIADFKKDKPTLFAVTGHGSPSNRDGRPPQPDNKVVLNRKPSL